MIAETLLGFFVIVIGLFILSQVYLIIGKVGMEIFKQKDEHDGFLNMFVYGFIIFAVLYCSYKLGVLLLG